MPVCLVYLGNNADYYIKKWVKNDPFFGTQYEGVLMQALGGNIRVLNLNAVESWNRRVEGSKVNE